MRYFLNDMAGGETQKLLILNPLEKLSADRSPPRMRLEMVDERIRIDEHTVSHR
jgi:hypothetical protein